MRAGFPGFMSAALPKREVFSPVDLTGLTLWLDAADFNSITKDGSNRVSNWADKSGNGFDAEKSGAARPTFVVNQLNAKPVINFDGSHEMALTPSNTTAGTGLWAIPGAANTRFIVSRRATESGTSETLLNMSDGTRADLFSLYATVSGSYTSKNRGAAGGALTNGGNTLTNFNIFRDRFDGTINNFNAVNGGTEVTNALASVSTGINSGDIGASNAGNLMLTGDEAEIIIYDSSLSVADSLLVETYLSNKWGIALA